MKVLDFAPFRGSYVREFELSHSIKQNYKNNSCTQFACEDVGLWHLLQFGRKKEANCFTTKFSQAILRNHLGVIRLIDNDKCKVDSFTFINFQENYQTAEIYFYLYHVTPLNTTVSYYCVN